MRKVRLMDNETRERFTELGVFAAYCGIVAVRELGSTPPHPGWLLGLVAAAACMFTLGYIYRGGHDRRKRRRDRS